MTLEKFGEKLKGLGTLQTLDLNFRLSGN